MVRVVKVSAAVIVFNKAGEKKDRQLLKMINKTESDWALKAKQINHVMFCVKIVLSMLHVFILVWEPKETDKNKNK